MGGIRDQLSHLDRLKTSTIGLPDNWRIASRFLHGINWDTWKKSGSTVQTLDPDLGCLLCRKRHSWNETTMCGSYLSYNTRRLRKGWVVQSLLFRTIGPYHVRIPTTEQSGTFGPGIDPHKLISWSAGVCWSRSFARSSAPVTSGTSGRPLCFHGAILVVLPVPSKVNAIRLL